MNGSRGIWDRRLSPIGEAKKYAPTTEEPREPRAEKVTWYRRRVLRRAKKVVQSRGWFCGGKDGEVVVAVDVDDAPARELSVRTVDRTAEECDEEETAVRDGNALVFPPRISVPPLLLLLVVRLVVVLRPSGQRVP